VKASHRADRTGRSKGTGRFVQLHNYVLESAAWRSLTLPARCALVEILRVYNGANNGQLGMAVRYLAERLRCGKTTASRALEELEQKGFIGVQKVGVFGRPMGSEYYVTLYRNDVNFEPPSKPFMKWREASPVPSQTSAVPPQVQSQQNYKKQYLTGDCKGPSEPNPSTQYGTHIHLPMGGLDAGSRSAPIGSAVASDPALTSIAAATLEPIESEPAPENLGSHAKRAIADLEARKIRRELLQSGQDQVV
jgi:hypothetical protein